MRQRKPVIGVMGGHKTTQATKDMAHELGGLIARRGWVLLTGGRNVGVMAASARGATDAGGIVIGILPGVNTKGASPDLDFAIPTGLGHARNSINVLASDVIIACPGALGTLNEVTFALMHKKPVILLGIDPGPWLDRYRGNRGLRTASDPKDAINQAARCLAGRSSA